MLMHSTDHCRTQPKIIFICEVTLTKHVTDTLDSREELQGGTLIFKIQKGALADSNRSAGDLH